MLNLLGKFKSTKLSKVEWLGIGFISLGACFWILASWPGTLTGDSIAVLYQIKHGPYYDWHPLSYTILVSLFTFHGKFIWLVPIVQTFILCFALIQTLRTIFKSLSLNRALWITGILEFTPFVGGLAVTMWKDVPYTAFSLIGFNFLIRYFQSKLKPWNDLLLSYIFLVLAATLRHEAPLTLIIIAIILVLIHLFRRKKSLSSAYKIITISAIVSFFLSVSLVSILNAVPAPRFISTLSFQRDLASVAHKNPDLLPKVTFDKIRSISDKRSWEHASDCWTPIDYINPTNFSYSLSNQYSASVISTWAKVLFSRAGPKLIKAHACFAKPFIPFPIVIRPDPVVISWLESGVSANSMGIKSSPKDLFFGKLWQLYFNLWLSIAPLVSWPGLHFSLFLLLIFLLFKLPLYHLSSFLLH